MSQSPPKLTHDWIWQAIDTLASKKGLTPSALARLASLDPTTFNKSKRFTSEGRPRWPSTESISKVLLATGTSLDDFAELSSQHQQINASHPVPSLAVVPILGEIRSAEVSDLRSMPKSSARKSGGTANLERPFALAVADASLEPVYSIGNTLVLSISRTPSAGDRVVVKPAGTRAIPRFVVSTKPKSIELASFGAERQSIFLLRNSIDWIARIDWARQ